MRTLALVIVGVLAWIAWFASTMQLERHRAAQALVHHADYPVCVRVNPGPLIKPKRVINGRPAISGLT